MISILLCANFICHFTIKKAIAVVKKAVPAMKSGTALGGCQKMVEDIRIELTTF